ncbi:prephenate dehydratase [Symbiobacterium thermophilum]|nr:prephenate dehydratase [Symbiobacterium thermophilum]MBY6277049.1 prephenate dehydratase [Symbiobacterium thermophilum]
MPVVAFQGELGAYGDEAVRARFGPSAEPYPCKSFVDLFEAVASGTVDYGLAPVENSQAGSINDVYDLLRQYDLYVAGEVLHPVNHALLALPGQTLSDIRRVISHPQALAQCDRFLRDLGVEVMATYDTAGAAKMIREQGLTGVAAVAGLGAAQRYGLAVLAESIQTIKDNITRFVVLQRDPAPREEGPQKTMLFLALAHQPGSLYMALGALANRNINLLKLESRPSRNRPWEYVFYLDFEGHRDDPHVRAALADLAKHANYCKVLGSFRRETVPD